MKLEYVIVTLFAFLIGVGLGLYLARVNTPSPLDEKITFLENEGFNVVTTTWSLEEAQTNDPDRSFMKCASWGEFLFYAREHQDIWSGVPTKIYRCEDELVLFFYYSSREAFYYEA